MPLGRVPPPTAPHSMTGSACHQHSTNTGRSSGGAGAGPAGAVPVLAVGLRWNPRAGRQGPGWCQRHGAAHALARSGWRCKDRAGLHHAHAGREVGVRRGPHSVGGCWGWPCPAPRALLPAGGTPGSLGRGRCRLLESAQPAWVLHPPPMGTCRILPSPGFPLPRGISRTFSLHPIFLSPLFLCPTCLFSIPSTRTLLPLGTQGSGRGEP